MQCSSDEERETIRDLRKDAMPKTAFENRTTYENMEWDKINRESNFAKEGILADADLLVIRGENQIVPAWDLRGYSFLFINVFKCYEKGI